MANQVQHWEGIVSHNMTVLRAVIFHDPITFTLTNPFIQAGLEYQQRLRALAAAPPNFGLMAEITAWRLGVAAFAQQRLGTTVKYAVDHFIQQDPAWVVPAGTTPFASLPPGTCLAVFYI